MASYVQKLVTLTPEQVEALRVYTQQNPQYSYNNRPNESAVVREALRVFLGLESSNPDQQPERKAS
jgi:hypothetical protein